MGLGGMSIWELVIIALLLVVLFGGKRLRGMGADLGETIKGFRKSLKDDEAAEAPCLEAPGAAPSGRDVQSRT